MEEKDKKRKQPDSESEDPSYAVLDYIQARKAIYLPLYVRAVRKTRKFQNLLKRFQQGEKFIIVDVDGPKQESLAYYQKTYGVPADWIQDQRIAATEENLQILLNDDKHPFGHGYCLAMELLGISDRSILKSSDLNLSSPSIRIHLNGAQMG